MEYLRKYLIYVRKTENLNPYKMKLSIFTLFLGIFGIMIGVLLDAVLPFSYFPNTLRGIIALITGATMFTFSYLKAVSYSTKKVREDRYYQKTRERFSYRQRANLSIVLGMILTIYVFITAQEGLMFTFNSSFAVFSMLVLLSFARRRRSEFIKDVYEIPDTRDLEKETRRKKKKMEESEDEK